MSNKVDALLEKALDTRLFECVDAHWIRGNSRLVLILGDNATGKSFFRRVVSALSHRDQVEALP
jgi:DNA replicative helicase MCM subunit Mcm2 (Cdc46/Mcm family)